jgi:S1-C subfamily serine protease
VRTPHPAATVLALLAAGAVGLAACSTATPAPPPGAQSTVPVTAEPIAAPSQPSQIGEILRAARQFVFRARNEACLGTGTAFATAGTIVTNRHVAAGAGQIDLATWDGTDFQSQVSNLDQTADLAQLSANAPGSGSAVLAAADPVTGTPVWVAGYPQGNQLTVTSGQVLDALPGAQFGISGPVLAISDPIQPGSSGSPLLDSSERVVGVVFAIDTRNGDGLAMPVSTLNTLLDSGGSIRSLPCADSPASPTTTTPAPAPAPTTNSSVEVVECPTTWGAPPSPLSSTPNPIPVNLPSNVADQLNYYTTQTASVPPLFGPEGWACNATVGADGSTGIDIYPPGSPAPSSGSPGQPGIHAASDGACQSCVWATVCRFVPAAGQQLSYTSRTCPAAPYGETAYWIKGSSDSSTPVNDVVGFTDPASPNPINGAVLYKNSASFGSASQDTCTLPATEHSLCTVILNNFISQAWLMNP